MPPSFKAIRFGFDPPDSLPLPSHGFRRCVPAALRGAAAKRGRARCRRACPGERAGLAERPSSLPPPSFATRRPARLHQRRAVPAPISARPDHGRRSPRAAQRRSRRGAAAQQRRPAVTEGKSGAARGSVPAGARGRSVRVRCAEGPVFKQSGVAQRLPARKAARVTSRRAKAVAVSQQWPTA